VPEFFRNLKTIVGGFKVVMETKTLVSVLLTVGRGMVVGRAIAQLWQRVV
jgi:hypothetical protein